MMIDTAERDACRLASYASIIRDRVFFVLRGDDGLYHVVADHTSTPCDGTVSKLAIDGQVWSSERI